MVSTTELPATTTLTILLANAMSAAPPSRPLTKSMSNCTESSDAAAELLLLLLLVAAPTCRPETSSIYGSLSVVVFVADSSMAMAVSPAVALVEEEEEEEEEEDAVLLVLLVLCVRGACRGCVSSPA